MIGLGSDNNFKMWWLSYEIVMMSAEQSGCPTDMNLDATSRSKWVGQSDWAVSSDSQNVVFQKQKTYLLSVIISSIKTTFYQYLSGHTSTPSKSFSSFHTIGRLLKRIWFPNVCSRCAGRRAKHLVTWTNIGNHLWAGPLVQSKVIIKVTRDHGWDVLINW